MNAYMEEELEKVKRVKKISVGFDIARSRRREIFQVRPQAFLVKRVWKQIFEFKIAEM